MSAQGPALAGRIALVTGSVRGIGRALAEGFARAGARVWIHGPAPGRGEELAKSLAGRYLAADFERPAEIAALAESLLASEERLDVLVNNAGLGVVMPLGALDLETLDRIFRVNVRAAVDLTQRLLPLLRKSPSASVINVTSIHQDTAYAHNAVYAMSKAALGMFTRTAALELAPFGIRVNNLAPGAVETEASHDVIEAVGRGRFHDWIPAGRVGTTEDVLGPALFLASDASRYVTGTTLYVDGGYRENLVRYRL